MRKTKIICTMGPATDTDSIVKEMILNGMNVARFNFSHDVHDVHKKRSDLVKKVRKVLNKPIALLLDTKGPEIRTGEYEKGSIDLLEGALFTLKCEECVGNESCVSINYIDLYKDVKVGDSILVDDGLIELIVSDIKGKDIICKVANSGKLSNKKSINVPGVPIKLPYMNDKDKQDVLFAIKNDFDFIAASFVRNSTDLKILRNFLDDNGGNFIKIISKIENREGVENIEEIMRISDGIMIARGDMGVEIPFEELPAIQKRIISLCNKAGKPVITATQMLDSMIKNPRPTRAEITDVANAIYDGTSAIMLSAETSIGKYPVEVIKTMSKIALSTESNINYEKRFRNLSVDNNPNITTAISHATCSAAHNLKAKTIITVTKSGHTARMISKYRPDCEIVAPTISEKVFYQLAISWGVIPIMTQEKTSTDEILDQAVERSLEDKYVKNGDLVILTGGFPSGMSGTTNILKVHIVGDVLLRATGANNLAASGTIFVAKEELKSMSEFNRGDILVLSKTTKTIIPLLKAASAIITEEDDPQSQAVLVGMALDIPVLYNASDATEILKSGTIATVDSGKGEVSKGIR
ncbi:MAG: pyruvate kinase [Candidatus Delongbacteria bacterium]|nr:pyruvate kinase [Candidatus Delongbacteria bacterium]MBN2836047.1 pyruvate kinase [Candidatus Delongbacteria bacterium]